MTSVVRVLSLLRPRRDRQSKLSEAEQRQHESEAAFEARMSALNAEMEGRVQRIAQTHSFELTELDKKHSFRLDSLREKAMLRLVSQQSKGTLHGTFAAWSGQAKKQRRLRALVGRIMSKQGWMSVVRTFGTWKVYARKSRRIRKWSTGLRVKQRLLTLRSSLYSWRTYAMWHAEHVKNKRLISVRTERQLQVCAVPGLRFTSCPHPTPHPATTTAVTTYDSGPNPGVPALARLADGCDRRAAHHARPSASVPLVCAGKLARGCSQGTP